ncbi:MAG: N-acetylneuraminate synthase family protein [Candidatus Woesearchaeota archaeon]|nr:N-acetylneuraminate synthase family protein [Candidatus Woesearchaeota archaeon]
MMKNKMDERIADIKIANKILGLNKPCFFIAEAGVNHNGSLETAKKLVDAAFYAGADAIKFQTFKAEDIVTPSAEQAEYQVKSIGKDSQYNMLKKLELSYDDFRGLKKYCDKKNIMFLTTPHSSKKDVDLAAELCPVIKVGSGDLTNLHILKYMAETKLPIILSTGMSTLDEIKEAVDVILPINSQLVLLHCTTSYPVKYEQVNLRAMITLKNTFNLITGYSDHTEGIDVSVAAVAMGAKVIEKHFTLDRNMEGPDHKASIEPKEMRELVQRIRHTEKDLSAGKKYEDIVKEMLGIEKALGNGIKKPYLEEINIAKVARKSIVADVDIKKDEKITNENIAIKRPGTGLHPRYFEEIIGKTAKKEIKKDEMIMLDDLK